MTSTLETLELPAALALVADHAAGPHGADRVRARLPLTDPTAVREALAQVAELASLLLTDESIRSEPVPDLHASLELLVVAGSVLEGAALADIARFLAAARVVGATLGRIERDAPRTAPLRAPAPPKELDTRLRGAIGPEGDVLDGASPALARVRTRI